jgi:hypothetical protein
VDWKHLLVYITGSVDQELLLRNEYLVTENQILHQWMKGRVRLTDGERKTLAAIGRQPGKQALKEIATVVKPDTILALLSEHSLSHALTQYEVHYHMERPHQGKGNVTLLPAVAPEGEPEGLVRCRERLGGLLKYYHHDFHEAA